MATAVSRNGSVWRCFCLSMILLVVISLARSSLGCFPVEDVFKSSCLWIQSTSMQSSNWISVCPENRGHEGGAPMKIEPEGVDSRPHLKRTLECLSAHGGYRYLVKVSRSQKVLGYQCIKFSPLTDKVVRQEHTAVVAKKEELNCEDAEYTMEEAVLIASFINLQPKPCPLSGGFQLLMRVGKRHELLPICLQSIFRYNPRIQFQCDQTDSPNVVIDLGEGCTSEILWDSQKLRGRYVAHLRCLDSWQENKGTSKEFTSILMGMRDSPRTYWCLHVKRLSNLGDTDLLHLEETWYQAFLTSDGRCLKSIHEGHGVPTETDMYGKLAAFIPRNSTMCHKENNPDDCKKTSAQNCAESPVCSSVCKRCKKKLDLQECSFPEEMTGSWESFGFDAKQVLLVEKSSVQGPSFGEFQCRSPKESGNVKGLYALVQSGAEETCMPYYSCAQMIRLAPGLLSFQMRPALRNIDSGWLYSCQETHARVGMIRPEKAEETVTLLQNETLKGISCHIDKDRDFPTVALVPNCRFLIHKCSGPCQVFNISLQVETCQNTSAAEYGLYTSHTCMAKIEFEDEAKAILTKVPDTDTYFCWLFIKSKLLVLRPDACNQNRINAIFKFEDELFVYDPVYQLVESTSMSAGKGHKLVAHLYNIGIVLLLTWLTLTRDIY